MSEKDFVRKEEAVNFFKICYSKIKQIWEIIDQRLQIGEHLVITEYISPGTFIPSQPHMRMVRRAGFVLYASCLDVCA